MTDDTYLSLTLHIRSAFDWLRPLTKDEQIDEAGIRSRAAISELTQIMEKLCDAQEMEDEGGRTSPYAIDVKPSLN